METEKDHYVIHDVVKAFRWFKDPRVVPGLISLLNHEKSIVRRETYYGLGIQKADETVEPIVKRLLHDKEQCVSAAAQALADINSEASKKILGDDTVYMYVLQQAKKSPRWAIRALNYFQLPRVNDDLLKLLSTTNEIEAYEYLSQGIAQRANEDSLPKIVAFGLDRYKGGNCIGRHYINMCCSIARAHPDGPDMEMVKQLKAIISESDKDDISDFTNSLVSDVNYADIGDPTDDEAQSEERYVEKTKSIFAEDQSEALALVNALFGIQ